MGQPKLLLPWGDWTLIDQLMHAWTQSAVDQTVVVIRAEDDELNVACGRWPVHVVQAIHAPRDMKESVQIGLRFVEESWRPASRDRCFVAPADLPGLTSDVINRLIEADLKNSSITVPQFGDRPGHPILLPWPVTQQIFDLSDDQGVNRIVEQNPKRLVSFPATGYFGDVDTPEEYRSSLPEHGRARQND